MHGRASQQLIAPFPRGVVVHGAAPAKLELNQGRKWETDAPLRQGMTSIRGAMETALGGIHEHKYTAAQYGALAVLDKDDGSPFVSRAGVATLPDGTPVILISGLSQHTQALHVDPRCSLLLGEPGKGDPLAHPRISLHCRAARLERDAPDHARVSRRYLNRHPKAALYAGFPDFAFFRLDIERASLNGGFGKAYLLAGDELRASYSLNEALAAAEAGALAHMNSDHGDAIDVYARAFAKSKEDGWTLTGIDAEGIDIARGDDSRRVFFDAPLQSAADLRDVLIKLAMTGRKLIG